MIENLIKHLSQYIDLSEKEIEAITEAAVIKTFDKGTTLLREGDISKECYFLLSGCIRKYTIKGGDEITLDFYTENQWILAAESYTTQTPSDHFLSCVEMCGVIVGNDEIEEALYSLYPRFESASRTILEHGTAAQQKRMNSFLTTTPEERYLELMETRPDLLQRVPQYQLASYLGIKPESLSRIRKRIAQKDSQNDR